MSAAMEQLLRAHIQEVRAHIVAAAAWRHWMDMKDDLPEDLLDRWRMPWIEAEERLAALLGPSR